MAERAELSAGGEEDAERCQSDGSHDDGVWYRSGVRGDRREQREQCVAQSRPQRHAEQEFPEERPHRLIMTRSVQAAGTGGQQQTQGEGEVGGQRPGHMLLQTGMMTGRNDEKCCREDRSDENQLEECDQRSPAAEGCDHSYCLPKQAGASAGPAVNQRTGASRRRLELPVIVLLAALGHAPHSKSFVAVHITQARLQFVTMPGSFW
jgi:hypothetical protein